NDSTLIYNTEVTDIIHTDDLYEVYFKDSSYIAESKIIINSAGLWCDKISAMVGINDYKLHYCKGEYYKTSKYRNEIKSLIYPLPNELSLGIHIVLHLDGTLGFGPNAYYIDKINYMIDSTHKQEFLKHINTYMELDQENLFEDFTGIRPKIQDDGESFRDFIIINESEKGYNNFINLIGIDSPGLTSSLAL
ncbi:NAD(P)/FAD-dependent oxidoreductase, partial [Candidatus Pelagibacter communis]|uniref:NAD(P)/FAD-dependent oxidoreductase n=1 Tax=Pelagibacter ubique TaxID=198252 RepID=UPI000B271EE9